MLTGAIVTYMFTKKGPQSLKDYFWAPTGGTNTDTTPERILQPGHEKDIAEMIEVLENPGFANLIKVEGGKISPFIKFAYETLMGEDYSGLLINPTNDYTSLVGRLVENLISNITPIIFQSQEKGYPKGSHLNWVTALLGIRPAPLAFGDPGAAEYYDVNQRYQQAVKKMYHDRNALRNYETPGAKAAYDRDLKDVQELLNQRIKARQDWNKSKVQTKYLGNVSPY
jgi:hypothetical protein